MLATLAVIAQVAVAAPPPAAYVAILESRAARAPGRRVVVGDSARFGHLHAGHVTTPDAAPGPAAVLARDARDTLARRGFDVTGTCADSTCVRIAFHRAEAIGGGRYRIRVEWIEPEPTLWAAYFGDYTVRCENATRCSIESAQLVGSADFVDEAAYWKEQCPQLAVSQDTAMIRLWRKWCRTDR